jgi:hypothetical protein
VGVHALAFVNRDDVLWENRRRYITEQQALRNEILTKFHDDPLAGHLVERRTKELEIPVPF